jgi:glycine oxidase
MIKQYAGLGLAIEPISLVAARKFEPAIGPEPAAAAWIPDEATVEPRALVTAVIAACKKRGVEFRGSQPVTALLRDGGTCTGLIAGPEKISARHVVVAAGGFTAGMESATASVEVADTRAIASFAPTHPVRGQMLALRNPKVHLTRVLRSERAYLVPRLDGRLIAGSTLENVGFDKQVTPEGLFKIRDGVRAMVPALVDSEIIETWAGLRPGTPDGLPIIGKTSVEGLIVATGHYRNGVLLAPATAAVVRDLIVKGKASIDIEAYSPLRFSERHAAA